MSKEKEMYNLRMDIIRSMQFITEECGYKSEELSIQEGDFISEIDDEDLEKYADYDSEEHAELMKNWEDFLKED
jgi:hypothetical protein